MQSLRTRVPWNILEAEPRAGSTKLAVAITYAFLMLAVLAVLLLVVAIPAQGQTYSMLQLHGRQRWRLSPV